MGWPSNYGISPEIKLCWVVRNAFTAKQDLIMNNCRIIVPMSLQKDSLENLHQGHQGVERCRLLAQHLASMVARFLQRYPGDS